MRIATFMFRLLLGLSHEGSSIRSAVTDWLQIDLDVFVQLFDPCIIAGDDIVLGSFFIVLP